MSLTSRVAFIVAAAAATASAAPPAPAPPSPAPSPAAAKAAPPARAALAPAPALEGTVVDPDGKPVAQAFVSAWPASPAMRLFPTPSGAALAVRTDASGRFRLMLRERGPHGLRVEAEGLAPSVVDRVLPSSAPLKIALAKGLAIEGVVRDGPTGIAVAGATVEARDERARDGSVVWEAGPAAPRATTDAQGRFRIQGLGAGPHTVVGRARGFGQAARRSINAGGRTELILYPTGTVTGLVRGPDGRPVADAKVVVEPIMRFTPGTRLETTDRQGRFEFLGVDPGGYRVVARHKDFAAGWANVTVDRQSDTEAAISLDPPLALAGRLVDGSERPVRGRVAVSEAAGAVLPGSLASAYATDVGADGRFRIAGLPGGAAVLSATAPGFGARRVEAELSAGRAETDLGAVAMEAGLTITGRVRDKAGQGLPDARVAGQPARRGPMMGGLTVPETTTEADGRFVLGGLEPGHYDLSVQAPGFGFARHEADAGAENVDIVAQPAGALTGTVVDENRRPVTLFRVNVRPVDRGGMGPGRVMQVQGSFRMQTFESPDGRFLIDDLAPAEVTLQVNADDREPASVSSVAVPAGGTADVGELRLGPGGTVRGSVVDAAGGAVGGATVRSSGPGPNFFGGAFPETATDAAGVFELRGLPAGSVNVVATHPAYAAGTATVEVEPAKGPSEARLVLSQGGRIEGRARKRDGTPVAGMVNVFSRTSAMMFSGNTSSPVGPDGTFVMEHVPAGRMTLALMLGSGPRFEGSQNQEVEVREGETTSVEFVLRDILVSGRVTRGGAPAPNMRVTVRPQTMTFMSVAGPGATAPAGGPQRLRGITREDGTYELLLDQPGRANFYVEAADGSVTLPQRPIEIPDVDRHVVDLDFAGLATLSGIVVDEDGETPMPRAFVFATPKEPRPGMARLNAETGSDGRFQLELDPGEYQVGARMQGYANVPETVSVGASGVSDVRLTVYRGGVVKGRVVDAAGRPRGGVFVQALGASGPNAVPSGNVALTLADGTFEMSGLGEMDHTLFARSQTGEFAFVAGVRAGREGITLTMRRGGRIQVRIVGPDGSPVSGAFANVTKIGGTPIMGFGSGPSDGEGLADLPTPAGTIEVRATKENLEGTGATVVAADAVAALEVRLAPKAASRSGN